MIAKNICFKKCDCLIIGSIDELRKRAQNKNKKVQI